jgi:hypothetical protein
MMELIGVTIHGDGKKNPQTAYKLYCSKKDQCPLFKHGKCIMASSLMNGRSCPCGEQKWEHGYTTRAGKYWKWYHEIKTMPQYNAMTSPDTSVYVVGGDELIINTDLIEYRKTMEDDNKSSGYYVDGYLLVTCWNDFYKYESDDFKKTHQFTKGFQIKISELTQAIVDKLLSLKPCALFNFGSGSGEIVRYQSEIMRDFKIVLKEYAPQFLKLPVSYIGKTAVLKTINPSTIKLGDNHKAIWDGEYITDKDMPIWASFKREKIESFESKTKPNDKFMVEITEESQVNENTIFM